MNDFAAALRDLNDSRVRYLFPGVSPAQGLVERTIDIRTFGLVPGAAALVIAAAVGGARLTGARARLRQPHRHA